MRAKTLIESLGPQGPYNDRIETESNQHQVARLEAFVLKGLNLRMALSRDLRYQFFETWNTKRQKYLMFWLIRYRKELDTRIESCAKE
jgi:hypothetical protein